VHAVHGATREGGARTKHAERVAEEGTAPRDVVEDAVEAQARCGAVRVAQTLDQAPHTPRRDPCRRVRQHPTARYPSLSLPLPLSLCAPRR
jgi:hypothetical protein